jgi:hypothetical protein
VRLIEAKSGNIAYIEILSQRTMHHELQMLGAQQQLPSQMGLCNVMLHYLLTTALNSLPSQGMNLQKAESCNIDIQVLSQCTMHTELQNFGNSLLKRGFAMQ